MGMVRGVHGGLRRVRRCRFLGDVEPRDGAGDAGLSDVLPGPLVPRLARRLARKRKVRPCRGDQLDRQPLHLDRVPVCVRRLYVGARNGVFPSRKGSSPRRGLRRGASFGVLRLLVHAIFRRAPRLVPVDDVRSLRLRACRPCARERQAAPLAFAWRVPCVGFYAPARLVVALFGFLCGVFCVSAGCRSA